MEVKKDQVIQEVLVMEDMGDQVEEVQMREEETEKDFLTVKVETIMVDVAGINVKLKDL